MKAVPWTTARYWRRSSDESGAVLHCRMPGMRQGQGRLRAMAVELIPDLVWRELNVLDELDYAVELGVLTLPAIAIDGELVFSSLPAPRQLRRELTRRL